jgi:hypothetical protein
VEDVGLTVQPRNKFLEFVTEMESTGMFRTATSFEY